jgi:hypothetical protein
MHKYNNQDHSMMTGLLAAKNILGANYDLWKVNVEQEYQEEFVEEEGQASGHSLAALVSNQPLVPERIQVGTATPAVKYEV